MRRAEMHKLVPLLWMATLITAEHEVLNVEVRFCGAPIVQKELSKAISVPASNIVIRQCRNDKLAGSMCDADIWDTMKVDMAHTSVEELLELQASPRRANSDIFRALQSSGDVVTLGGCHISLPRAEQHQEGATGDRAGIMSRLTQASESENVARQGAVSLIAATSSADSGVIYSQATAAQTASCKHNVAYPSAPMTAEFDKVTSARQCWDLCQANSQCQFWGWEGMGSGAGAWCSLRSGSGQDGEIESAGYQGGARGCLLGAQANQAAAACTQAIANDTTSDASGGNTSTTDTTATNADGARAGAATGTANGVNGSKAGATIEEGSVVVHGDAQGNVVPSRTTGAVPTATNGGGVVYKDVEGASVSEGTPGPGPPPHITVRSGVTLDADISEFPEGSPARAELSGAFRDVLVLSLNHLTKEGAALLYTDNVTLISISGGSVVIKFEVALPDGSDAVGALLALKAKADTFVVVLPSGSKLGVVAMSDPTPAGTDMLLPSPPPAPTVPSPADGAPQASGGNTSTANSTASGVTANTTTPAAGNEKRHNPLSMDGQAAVEMQKLNAAAAAAGVAGLVAQERRQFYHSMDQRNDDSLSEALGAIEADLRHTAVGDMKRLLATEKELQSASDEMLNIAPVYQPSQLAIDASHSQRLRNLVRAERQPVQRLAPYVHR